tara:strand:- start:3135 stop:3695 length:561 start_codon:yes stop_codon:yes gene_type:complete
LHPPLSSFYLKFGRIKTIMAEREEDETLVFDYTEEHLDGESRKYLETSLFKAVTSKVDDLRKIKSSVESEWGEADLFYRFYHNSFKVYRIQEWTKDIVSALQSLLPDREMNSLFMSIVSEGTGVSFKMEHNNNWSFHTRPLLEAYFHAKRFLDSAIESSDELEAEEEPPNVLSSSWATTLYLFDLR